MKKPPHHELTTLESVQRSAATSPQSASRDALVVLWCGEEPSRVGEVVLLPPVGTGESLVFGRGDSKEGRHERARLLRQRPGENIAMPPLATAHISRAQLVLRSHTEGGVFVQNAGKRALVVGGRAADEARARDGDLVEIGSTMVLLCTRRPETLPALRAHAARFAFPFGEVDPFGYVGESPEAWRLRDEIAMCASGRDHVLLLGESGSGKELVAQAIHALSPRAARPLLTRNAATIPSGIIDAELFGNRANYPNAGMPERPGLVGEADGSTLLLDEIGELPSELQAHLLRLLDGGDYQRLGDAKRRTADLRVVAATNRPVPQLKHDLAARFMVRVSVPSLEERREDVPLLARHLVRAMAERGDANAARFLGSTGEPRISRDLVAALATHLYTTHVREVASVLQRAAIESRDEEIELTAGARTLLGGADSEVTPENRDATREAIVAAMAKHAGVRERVWRELGLPNRYVLKRLLKRHGIAGDDDD
jgi:transcriptional regulator with AAA-type ATPase domain